jgi:hypothetical protein
MEPLDDRERSIERINGTVQHWIAVSSTRISGTATVAKMTLGSTRHDNGLWGYWEKKFRINGTASGSNDVDLHAKISRYDRGQCVMTDEERTESDTCPDHDTTARINGTGPTPKKRLELWKN